MIFIIIPLILLIIVFSFLVASINHSENIPEFQPKYHSSYYVLTVKNVEDSIEGIIRSLIWQTQTSQTASEKLVVIDLDSDDSTQFILKQLAKEYPFIHPMSKTEYINFVSEL